MQNLLLTFIVVLRLNILKMLYLAKGLENPFEYSIIDIFGGANSAKLCIDASHHKV